MAKHITKTVIEDIAEQLKSAGMWVHEYSQASQTERERRFNEIEMDLSNPMDVIDDLTTQLAQVLVDHDPTFDYSRFMSQASYKLEI
jgi:hypothetical protein